MLEEYHDNTVQKLFAVHYYVSCKQYFEKGIFHLLIRIATKRADYESGEQKVEGSVSRYEAVSVKRNRAQSIPDEEQRLGLTALQQFSSR